MVGIFSATERYKFFHKLQENIQEANMLFVQEVVKKKPKDMETFNQIPITPFSNFHNIIVTKRGETLFEGNFIGIDPDLSWPENYIKDVVSHPLDAKHFISDEIHTTRSVTKSIIGILLINALKDSNSQLNIESPISEVFPELKSYSPIRVCDILNMAVPMNWDEQSIPYSDPNNPEYKMISSDNPHVYSLKQLRNYLLEDILCDNESKKVIGKEAGYNSCMTVLSAFMVEKITGKDLITYADDVIFKPMQIEYTWDRLNPSGLASSSAGLRISPNGMLKIGQSLLNDWLANNEKENTKDILSLIRKFCIKLKGINAPYDVRYGLHSRVVYLNFCERTNPLPMVYFSGIGGNVIAMLPEEQIVYVITGGNYTRQGIVNAAPWGTVVKDFIFPGCGLTTI